MIPPPTPACRLVPALERTGGLGRQARMLRSRDVLGLLFNGTAFVTAASWMKAKSRRVAQVVG